MIVKNKLTGEIKQIHDGSIIISLTDENNPDDPDFMRYKSLKELNSEWEDYEEPKGYWYLTDAGCLCQTSIHNDKTAIRKRIGNYFETKEEAEKAMEKLRAWKRLKDKGFKVDLWDYDGGNYQERIKTGRILFRVKDYEENDKDLDLLFCTEEKQHEA